MFFKMEEAQIKKKKKNRRNGLHKNLSVLTNFYAL